MQRTVIASGLSMSEHGVCFTSKCVWFIVVDCHCSYHLARLQEDVRSKSALNVKLFREMKRMRRRNERMEKSVRDALRAVSNCHTGE